MCQLYHYLFQWNCVSGKQQGRTNELFDPLKKSHKLHPFKKRNQSPKTKPQQEASSLFCYLDYLVDLKN